VQGAAEVGAYPEAWKDCGRTVHDGNFTHTDGAGANDFHFSGRLHGRALPKGRYTVTAVPRFHSLPGHALTVGFKIL
jgi:hypothetical protein